jgi:RND family efflux transporter MFP subunit
VEVAVESFPGRTFSGEVTYLSPEVAAETRTVRARIDVENPERLLRPGMFATVRLVDPHTKDASPALVVPDGAVVRRGGETLVFVPAPDPEGEHAGARFEARPVELGRQEAGWVEVLSGLEAGGEVVTSGTFFLESELAREELGGGHGH